MFARSRPNKDRDKDDRDDRERDRDKSRKSSYPKPTEEKKRRKKSKLSEDITDTIAGQAETRRRRRTSLQEVMDQPRSSSRSSLPYPSFSKAHSRESVLPLRTTPDILTPDATEVGASSQQPPPKPTTPTAPPSPPLTSVDDIRKSASPISATRSSSTIHLPRPKAAAVEVVLEEEEEEEEEAAAAGEGEDVSSQVSAQQKSAVDSDATSVAPSRPTLELFPAEPDAGGLAVSPITPTQSSFSMRNITEVYGTNPPHYGAAPPTPFDTMSPQPPPPPPPPLVPHSTPRVDYLLHNGGLGQVVPRTLLATTNQKNPQNIEGIFAPYHELLDQYSTVMEKNGSIAVATGYKSVARRLLGRLENVFARDISSHTCQCVMCQDAPPESERVGWGEILEWVGGRRETPSWPPFDFEHLGGVERSNRGSLRTKTPMQLSIDDDIPEEYRDHYIRQSAKTKKSVDKWLMAQPEDASGPPPEVDNETLTFTILTHLKPDDRPLFTTLMAKRSDVLPKAGTALQRLYRLPTLPRDPEIAMFLLQHHQLHNVLATLSAINSSEWDILTSGRFDGFLWSGADDLDPSSSSFGRSTPSFRAPPSRAPSRGPQSFPFRSASRTSNAPVSRRGSGTPFQNLDELVTPNPSIVTPGTSSKAVPLDEEQEIAALAEIEREIYVGMEALEDAFEALHRKAEAVRQLIRERGAGLSSSATTQTIEVVAGTPGPAGGGVSWSLPTASDFDEESEAGDVPPWRGTESVSELAPDDSASNISSARHRRPKRRNERRTPAPVEEESEEEAF